MNCPNQHPGDKTYPLMYQYDMRETHEVVSVDPDGAVVVESYISGEDMVSDELHCDYCGNVSPADIGAHPGLLVRMV